MRSEMCKMSSIAKFPPYVPPGEIYFFILVAHTLKSVFSNFHEYNCRNDETEGMISLPLFSPPEFPSEGLISDIVRIFTHVHFKVLPL